MAQYEKLLDDILRGTTDNNVRFDDLRKALLKLGFAERIRGSHHLYTMPGVDELINLQREGPKAKPYQIRQVRNIIVKYRLTGEKK